MAVADLALDVPFRCKLADEAALSKQGQRQPGSRTEWQESLRLPGEWRSIQRILPHLYPARYAPPGVHRAEPVLRRVVVADICGALQPRRIDILVWTQGCRFERNGCGRSRGPAAFRF